MCDCTTGCNECNITSLTKGEKGDRGATGATGPGGIYFASFEDTVLDDTNTFFTYTIVQAGNYVLQLECSIEISTGETPISSFLYKNGVYQSANMNNTHASELMASGSFEDESITYTHNAKLTSLIVGDVVGFSITSGFSSRLINGSITLLKLT